MASKYIYNAEVVDKDGAIRMKVDATTGPTFIPTNTDTLLTFTDAFGAILAVVVLETGMAIKYSDSKLIAEPEKLVIT